MKLIKYLEKMGVSHELLEHKKVYTAIDAANTLKRKMDQIAKSLLVKADKDYYLVLLPADKNLNEEKIRKLISKQRGKEVKTVKIPGEKIMQKLLKIKEGALGAFGSFHKLPVIVDKELEKARKVVFPSGGFNHSVELAVKDFLKLEEAVLANIGVKKKIKTPKKKVPQKKVARSSSTSKKSAPQKKSSATPKTGRKKTLATKKTASQSAKAKTGTKKKTANTSKK